MASNTKKTKRKPFRFSRKVFAYPYVLFLMVFVVLPLVILLVNAFLVDGNINWENLKENATIGETLAFITSELQFTFDNFASFFTESHNMSVLFNSLLIGFAVTLLCLLIGYPVAYLLSKKRSGAMLTLLFILPMWINFLVRTLATKSVFEAMGVELGLVTLIIGLVYNFLPFMIMPLSTTLSGIDKSYIEAAQDLGADNFTVFTKTVLPLSLPGIISGITMVFIPTISTFAISQYLSGSASIMLFGDSIYEKINYSMYGVGSVMSLVMLAFVLISNFFMNKFNATQTEAKDLW